LYFPHFLQGVVPVFLFCCLRFDSLITAIYWPAF